MDKKMRKRIYSMYDNELSENVVLAIIIDSMRREKKTSAEIASEIINFYEFIAVSIIS